MIPSVRSGPTQTSVPERASILLFALNHLPEVVTELKLQKLLFQVQSEAKIPGGYRYFKHHYGPYSRELSLDAFTLSKQGLIDRRRVFGHQYPYWIFKITDEGSAYFNKSILPNIDSSSSQRMLGVLEKYSNYRHYELAELVYKEWMILQPEELRSRAQILTMDIQTVSNFWQSIYFPECPAITYFLAFLEYSQDALSKVSSAPDTVKMSVLISACRELCDTLEDIGEVCSKEEQCPLEAEKNLCQTPDPSIYETFDFIEDFCERNGILPKLCDRDLADSLTEEDAKRLQSIIENGV